MPIYTQHGRPPAAIPLIKLTQNKRTLLRQDARVLLFTLYKMPCVVRYYILLYDCSKKNTAIKHIERKFKKIGRHQDLFFHKYVDLATFVQFLSEWSRKHLGKELSGASMDCVGFINPYCKLIQNLCFLPEPPLMHNYCPTCKGPLDFDLENSCCRNCQGKDVQLQFIETSPSVLCLHSNIKRVVMPANNNNMYWAEVECTDSLNFVLNPHYVSTFCKLLGAWESFSEKAGECTFDKLFGLMARVGFPKQGVYTVLQYNFTEERNKYIIPDDRYFAKTTSSSLKAEMLENYYKAIDSRSSELAFPKLGASDLDKIHHVQEHYNNLTGASDQYRQLPAVSIITSINDINKFFVLLHCFFTMNYPRDLLKLYVCDQYDMNKKFAHIITNDPRVVFLSMQTKDEQHVPLGYQLNAAMKYVETDLVTFMFDDSMYDPNYIRNSVMTILGTDTSLIFNKLVVSNRTLDAAKKWKYRSCYFNVPNLGSIFMYKYVWNMHAFLELEDDPVALFYNFCKYRTALCTEVSFVDRTFTFEFSRGIYNRLLSQSDSLLVDLNYNLFQILNEKQREAIQVYQKCIKFRSEECD